MTAEAASNNPKTSFNILMIGPSGSGKTVYLAALWHKLCVPSKGDLNFFLSLPDQQEKVNTLTRIYHTIQFDTEWPAGTANVSSWSFECCVRNEEGKRTKALTFNYLDYAGGNFGEFSEVDTEVQHAIRDADGYLVLVDGLRLLQLHQGKRSGIMWASQFGSTVIPPLLQDSSKPTQFVISKWDVLQAAGLSLSDCKKILFTNIPQVTDYVRPLVKAAMIRGNRKASIRVYPVSSVGDSFAWYDDEKDVMVKRGQDAYPQPLNVEYPLTSLIPLYIEKQIYDEEEELSRVRDEELRLGKRPEMELSDELKVGAKKGFDRFSRLPFAGSLFKWAGEKIGGEAERRQTERVGEYETKLQDLLSQQRVIADELRAQRYCCDMFLSGMHTYEAMNPECVVMLQDLPS